MTDSMKIHSEVVEPTMAYIIGRLFIQCEQVRETDHNEFFNRCQNFWYGVSKINDLATACNASHFSMTARNELQRVADYIKKYLDIDPILDKHPQFKF